jgi:hypothetical protein
MLVRSHFSPIALICCALAAAPSAAAATQEGYLLIGTPGVEDPADSAYALAFAKELRNRFRWAGDYVVVRTNVMCERLQMSDFSCDELMSHLETEQLASATGAQAFVVGHLARDTGVVLDLRLHDRRRTGFSGRVTVRVPAGSPPPALVEAVVQAMQHEVVAARSARYCYDYRDRGEYEYAKTAADGAFAVNPRHPSAALCLASVYELTGAPPDSLIAAYATAVAGDSLQLRAQDRLAQLYLDRGDSAAALGILTAKLRREPGNQALRKLVAAGWISAGHADSAMALLTMDGVGDESDVGLVRLVAATCAANELWSCHFDALGRLYALDSSLVGDTAYYYRIIAAAQEAGDGQAVLTWTTEAVRQTQAVVAAAAEASRQAEARLRDVERTLRALHVARAAALAQVGLRDSALAAYAHLRDTDPTDPRPVLAAAHLLVDEAYLRIDSAAALDTAALRRADSLLAAVATPQASDDVRQTAAAIYFGTASRLVRAHQAPRLAADWLEKALAHDVGERVRETAHSLLGLALFYVVQELDAAIREEQTCDLVSHEEQVIARAHEATAIGRAAFPAVAQRVMEGLDAYGEFVPQFRAALRCGDDSANGT